VRTFVGVHDGTGKRVAVVAARFNEAVTAKLVEGAVEGLRSHGVDDDAIDVAWVPGAFEIPVIAGRLARSGRYDAVICLGAVIRGETAHFDLVAGEAARGIADVAAQTGVPTIFEVLATEDLPQAESRAGGVHGNKGFEAARAALEMVWLMESLPVDEPARGR
jgi:6,7-dimethyl-8-ribityllumazine synthase